MLHHLALRVMMLMLFVVSQTPVLPAAVTLAVWMDGSHKVEFTAGSDGLTLLLRHQRKIGQTDNALPQGHQHGLLTRAVLTFAQSQGATHPDHKLSFKNATERYERSSLIESATSKHTPQSLPLMWVDTKLDLEYTHTTPVHASSREDVIASPGVIGLRTVVMLI